jgi:hypothetical protein
MLTALRLARAAALAGASLLLVAPAAAQPRQVEAREYDCTMIASTNEFPYGVDTLYAPSMNAWGQVLFMSETRTEDMERIYELRVGRGEKNAQGVPRTHAVARAGRSNEGDPLGPFDILQEAMIEDQGRVAFLAMDPPTGGPPGQGIYRVFTDHPAHVKPSPLYATEAIGGSFLGFDPLPTLGANSQGLVVFSAFTDEGLAFYRNGSVIARNGEGGIQLVGTPVLIHPGQPWTVFRGQLDGPQGDFGIWLDGALLVTAELGQGFEGLSIGGSSFPLVAYSRTGFPGVDTWELVRHNGIGEFVLVDADEDPFEPFANPRETSINSWGDVAFVSSPEGDGDTLLVADGGDVIHAVQCRDMVAVFGTSVFFDLALSSRGMNSDGQIAFLARAPGLVPETGDFETFVVRADPRPGAGAPPTSCVGIADETPCDDGDPITLSLCANEECTADPSGPPTSCVGLPNDTSCDDGDPGTISFCDGEECVGFPLPVPEPGAPALGVALGLALAVLRRVKGALSARG